MDAINGPGGAGTVVLFILFRVVIVLVPAIFGRRLGGRPAPLGLLDGCC